MSIETNRALSAIASLTREITEVNDRSQTIAAAAEEMVASVREISNSSEAAAADTNAVSEAVERGRDSSRRAVETMQQIAGAVDDTAVKVDSLVEASSQIGEIIGEIEAIASQTNLLALNATIEAARAGESGKGFAVVASEVKSLAGQTADATEDIRTRIGTLRSEMDTIVSAMQRGATAVEEGRTVVEETGREMEIAAGQVIGVNDKMQEIAGILAQQQDASAEVAHGVHAIAGLAAQNTDEVQRVIDAMNSSDELIQKQLHELEDLTSSEAICTFAMSDHVVFMKKVMETLCGHANLHAEDLPDHHHCRLGKWYDGETDVLLTGNDAFQKLVGPHERVHQHGWDALRKYQAGDIDDALAEAELLEEASKEVLELLGHLADHAANP